MARNIKRRNTQNHQEIKRRRRKPNIPELIYKFLVTDRAVRDAECTPVTKCRRCNYEEVVDSADSPRNAGRSTNHRPRRDSGRISKSRGVKRRPTTRDLPAAYLQKCVGGEGTRKARTYVKRALEFGVESGYLIPADSTCKILRVSSDLLRSSSRKSSAFDRGSSQERDRSPHEDLDEYQQQGARRRRRRRRRGRARRSRSASRARRRSGRRRRGARRSRSRSRRGRRCSSPQNNVEEVAEDDMDDYEMDENDPKTSTHTDDTEGKPKSMESDRENASKKPDGNVSDLSVDEDETDDEGEKPRTNITKS